MKAPAFWYRSPGFFSALLSPVSIVYMMSSLIHKALTRTRSIDIPVICVGNITVGGTGKTPCVAAIAKLLHQKGYCVHILSRGYGGCLPGPVPVNPEKHTQATVGDEPLLLTSIAPTWISKNRYKGALAARKAGAQIIVMDDGLQNYDLHKDFNILVIDQKLGFGNGSLLPSGPLRESLNRALKKADAIFLTNTNADDGFLRSPHFYKVITQVVPEDRAFLLNKRIFAFSGIAHPQKFYESLKHLGVNLIGTRDFADHHPFTPAELESLEAEALRSSAILVTTEKDWVRLNSAWRHRVYAVRIENHIEKSEHLLSLLDPLLKRIAA